MERGSRPGRARRFLFYFYSAIFFSSLLLGLPTSVISQTNRNQRYEYALQRMGTQARVVLYAKDAMRAEKAATAVFDRIEQLEETLSDYRDESELNRLSREAVNRPQGVSPDLFFVLEQAQKFSSLSRGSFDITIGPVVQLWREARRTGLLPSPAEIEKARRLADYRNVELDPPTRTVTLKSQGMQLDLGGIAKGYAADQAIEVLRALGIGEALVALGGDIRVIGAPPRARGWKIDVENPDPNGRRPLCSVLLRDEAISTSGDTHQYLAAEGERFSHIVRPTSGWGLRKAAGTTVIARDGISADALATALSVMSPGNGLAMIESVEGASAFLVRRTGKGFEYFRSRGFPRACGENVAKE